MAFQWPSLTMWVLAVPSMVLYGLILIAIFMESRYKKTNNGFRSPFYSLSLSQGLADFLAVINYFPLVTFKNLGLTNEFYWKYRNHYMVGAWCYNHLHFFLSLRAYGIFLITFQRYLVLCHPHNVVTKKIESMPRIFFFLIHWIPTVLINLPILLNYNITFDNIKTLNLVIDKPDLEFANLFDNIVLVVFFLSTIFFYFLIFIQFFRHIRHLDIGTKKDYVLTIQVVGLILSFAFTCTFYVSMFIAVKDGNNDLVIQLRFYGPISIIILSIVNPWSSIIVNKDLRRAVTKRWPCYNGWERRASVQKSLTISAGPANSLAGNRTSSKISPIR